MKWEKVGRMPLDVKGRIVKWAAEKNLELVRIDSVYQFFEEEDLYPSVKYILCRCSDCKHVQILAKSSQYTVCDNCNEIGNARE